MDFFINKGATLNKLKLELINDGRNDFHKFHEAVQNANITFTIQLNKLSSCHMNFHVFFSISFACMFIFRKCLDISLSVY